MVPVLDVSNLGICFGGLQALDDFNIQVNGNEIVGLIGPNGAGKTTVFNLLTNVYRPTKRQHRSCRVQHQGKTMHQVSHPVLRGHFKIYDYFASGR